jgi:diguanylate cyclase (GGDEF)-like protein
MKRSLTGGESISMGAPLLAVGISALVLFGGALLLWFQALPHGVALGRLIDDLAATLGVVFILLVAFTGLGGRRRPLWNSDPGGQACVILGGGLLCFAGGSLLSALRDEPIRQPSILSPATVFALAAYALLLYGIFLLTTRSLPPTHRLRAVLDGLTLMVSSVTFVWYFLLGPADLGTGQTWAARVSAGMYPLCDLALLSCVLLVWLRGEGRIRPQSCALMALGAASLAAADSIIDYQTFHGGVISSGIIYVLWPFGYMLVGLGIVFLPDAGARQSLTLPPLGATEETADVRVPPLWAELAPYGPVPAVALLTIYALGHPAGSRLDYGVFVGIGVLALLLVLRQILTILDNRRLYLQLHDAFTAQSRNLARRITELEWLRTISQRLNGAHTLDAVLDIVFEGVRNGLGYDRVGFNLIDHESGVFIDCMGTDSQGRQTRPMDRSMTLDPAGPIRRLPGFGAMLDGAEFFYTTDAAAECPPELLYLYDGNPKHNLMVPIRSGDRVTGVISVDNLLSGLPIFPEDADPLLALAHHVGTAVENARLLEHEQAERVKLATMATTDALTTLPNRLLLHQRLELAIEAAARTHASVALLLMDLDRFKEVNDTLGHHAGDMLLREVSARLRAAVRGSDTVARLGGDEFSVVLPYTDREGAIHVASTLLQSLEAPIVIEGQRLVIESSVGIALFPDHGTDVPLLLRHADVAMYVAKRAKSRYAVYSLDADEHSTERLTLVSELRAALREGGLRLNYQPLVDLQDGRLVGVEALSRWRHPVQGEIPPDQFIPLAEQSDVIIPLTSWVLETALNQTRMWERADRLCLSIGVNLSARVLHDPSLPQTVARLLNLYGISPPRLTLEITESALMADPTRALDVLTRLGALGVQLAVDDFGTGYSSLAYLKQWPVQVLKIDKSFVLGLGTTRNLQDIAIVRSVVALGKALGMQVVAEGVETREAWDTLHGLGCTLAQGYYMSRPLSGEDLPAWAGQEARRVYGGEHLLSSLKQGHTADGLADEVV